MIRSKLPLRFTLSAVITGMTICVSLAIFLISYFGGSYSLLLLTHSMTKEISKGIIEKTDTLLDSAERANALINTLIRSGILHTDDGGKLMELAAQIVSNNHNFTSVDIGLTDGSKFKAERMPDDSVSKRCYVRDTENVFMNWIHQNKKYNDDPQFKNTVRTLAEGYDCRTRPWWITATKNKETSWTDMYVSGLRKQFLYSCVTPIYDDIGNLLAVSSIDINVVALSEFLGSLNILQHGKAFIFNEKKQFIAVPIKNDEDIVQLAKQKPDDEDEPYQLYTVDDLPDENIRKSAISFLDTKPDGHTTREFEYSGENGEKFIASFTQFQYDNKTSFTIGIIVPKRDIMANINKVNIYILCGIFLTTLGALATGLFFSKTISGSLSLLAHEVDKAGKLQLDSNTPIDTRILEIHNIDASVNNMKNGLRSFKKYVPSDLVAELNELRKEAVLEGECRELTVFFSDIVGFTSISERLAIEELVENLGVYFGGMTKVIHEHNGTVDKYIGDSIMAFWGAPILRPDHASLACSTALACQEFLDGLCSTWEKAGRPPFHTRIGLHTGEVVVGNIGYEERMNYTIIGDNVNLASRLEGLNTYYGTRILISDSCRGQAGDEYVTRTLDMVAVKGKAQGVLIHELLGGKSTLSQEIVDFADQYNRGMDLYFRREWDEALRIFQETGICLGRDDLPSSILARRCLDFMASPPGDGWTGVFQHTRK